MRPGLIRRRGVSKPSLSELKKIIIELADAPLLHKGVLAEKAIKEAIAVIDDHDYRLDKVEQYIRGQHGKE